MSESSKKTASSIAKRMVETRENLWNQLTDALIEAGYPREAKNHHNCGWNSSPLECVLIRTVANQNWNQMDAFEFYSIEGRK